MLMNGKDLLAVANEHNFAIPAFNVSDYAMMNGLFEISERKNSPMIVAIHPDEVENIRRALAGVVRPGTPVLAVSGVSGVGLPELVGTVFATIRDARGEAERGELSDELAVAG